MFKQWKGFLSGIIFTLTIMIVTGAVFAAATNTNIEVYYDNIKVLLNGKEIEFKDAKGNNLEPFNHKGTIYVPIRGVLEALNKVVDWSADSKQVKIYDTEIDKFWDNLVEVPKNLVGFDFYWRHIDDDIMEAVDNLVEKHGVDVLFKGLESTNIYSQYYCINRLVEYYNENDIRISAIEKITPFLNSSNTKLKDGAEFAISVLTKKFDSPYIVNVDENTKIFALFNDYSDYGSYNELWIIRNDKLSKLHSFSNSQDYIDRGEKIQVSPSKDKIAVQTSSRRSSSINIIDLNSGEISPELMKLAIEKVAKDNKDYNNTYPDGRYSWGSNLKWVDNNTLEFEAGLSYNFMEIIENVIVKYDVLNNSLEYIKQFTETALTSY
ncbi:copper amine oxidase N-terminal domain-containing protein [Paratissierella segnis]|uniref:Copper amine oxidase-like N-terminal domain-containing protein n=1 Tax=Paratissierella segnis TaxID=2763679 RepID=A0A926EWD0_9FIRM|nr:copper amine oxidase N-terminal domain-containing protein [Paratissierella segnis]MBC8587767.1 hypothetical protein [Paratissierella segnis]